MRRRNRMGGRMRQGRSLAAKRRRRKRLEELDDCSTLCFPKKENISNMEAEQQPQGPQRQTIEKTNIPSERDNCSDCGQVILCAVWCVCTFMK